MQFLRIDESSPYRQLVGVGGLGTGIFFAVEGNQTIGRNESRAARLLNVKDYCKLHIVIHYVAKLLRARPSGHPFRVVPFGCVGSDPSGNHVVDQMASVGIDTKHIRTSPNDPTLFSVCFQYPDGTGGNITTNNSAAATLDSSDIQGIAELMAGNWGRTIALAVPEVPLDTRSKFLEMASRERAFCAASFVAGEIGAARQLNMFEQLNFVAFNQSEAEEFVDSQLLTDAPDSFIGKCQALLRTAYPGLNVVVSAGKTGAYAITTVGTDFCPAMPVEVASTAGAGDSLLGGILAGMAAGLPLLRNHEREQSISNNVVESALQLGVCLASYKCQSPHTIAPNAALDTLIEFVQRRGFSLSSAIEKLLTF